MKKVVKKIRKGTMDMKLQELLSYTRKAVDEDQMIEGRGSHCCLGISGGRQSDASSSMCSMG